MSARLYTFLSIVWLLSELLLSTKATKIPKPSTSKPYLLNLLLSISIISSLILGYIFINIPNSNFISNLLLLFSIFAVILGIVIRAQAIQQLGENFTADISEVEENRLVTSGLYDRVRHPSYTGSFVALFGLMLLSYSMIAVMYGSAAYISTQYLRIQYEEKRLQEEFGSDYMSYKDEVPHALIPHII